ncbi:methyltransferase [Kitasatospora viridis]|uniref:Hydroxyneurosporene-O-methyltransferase n=1 Tax=Kitasatospora viridis TaxID=281105 RepID=A0A561UKE5_9ACTN|nr:ArsR family transcriptional regulator [Kitasatospora viridis]TWF99833.1 hydroxyneurosporene-O-methyltransferase [Kitasatospora viridis]
MTERTPGYAERVAMFGVLTGGWTAQCCYALTRLGVPDLLADGPRPVAELAAETGADPHALRRVLGVLAAAELFTEDRDRYGLTPVTRLLCTGTTRSSAVAATLFGEEVYQSFGEILHTLRTGQPAFEKVHGAPFYSYLEQHPETSAAFSAAMGTASVPTALAGTDLSGLGTLVDVGGGDGGLLARVLARHPQARGVLVELPKAVDQARTKLTEAGLADRVEFAPGSFFDPLPTGGDVYTLTRVLHNWDDEQAVAILRRVREAMPAHGRLLVFERLEEEPGAAVEPPANERAAQAAFQGRLIDLLMLLTLDGRDRTEAEYRTLLSTAGFEVRAVRSAPLRSARAESLIEAVPSSDQ